MPWTERIEVDCVRKFSDENNGRDSKHDSERSLNKHLGLSSMFQKELFVFIFLYTQELFKFS